MQIIKLFFLIFLLFYQKDPLTFDSNNYFSFTYNDRFIIITKDSIFSTVIGQKWSSINHDINFDDFQKKTIKINNEVFIISNGLGKVYKFSKDENLESKLSRVDNTENWRSNFDSFLFNFNDEIYSFGGYGFYSYKKELLKFNKISKEWDLVDDNYFNSPVERSNPIGQLDYSESNNPKLLIGMGANYYYKDQLLNDVWEYNLVNNKWTFKGSLNNHFSALDEKFSNNSLNPIQYKYKKNSILHDAHILFMTNKLRGYDLKNNFEISYPSLDFNIIRNVHDILYNETTDFFMLIEKPVFGIAKPVFVKKDDLLGKPVYSKLYVNNSSPFIKRVILIILVIVFLIVLLFIFKVKKQSVETIKVKLKTLNNELSDEELKIINILIRNHPNNTSFPEILNFYEQSLSYESRIKKLRLSLSHIDYIIKTQTKNKSYLIYSKNKNDKRIKQVKIHY